ncbi:MAG: hypothetical protein WCX31_16690 [Salinivirgaceae bacterium]|jgi:hypothetical protein
MTNKETVERNIGLTFDFVNYLVDNPKEAENMPDKFKLEFVEKDFPKNEKKVKIKSGSQLKSKYVRVRNTFELTK